MNYNAKQQIKAAATVAAAVILGAAVLNGCGWTPRIESKDMPLLFDALGKDSASGCAWLGGRGGGGAATVVPAPVIPLGGGWGSGEILFGRVNSPNTKLIIDNGKCVIERGADKEESATILYVVPRNEENKKDGGINGIGSGINDHRIKILESND